MKTQLIRIIDAVCDIAKSLLELLEAILLALWSIIKKLRHPVVGKILLAAIAVLVLIAGIWGAHAFYKERYSRYYYYEEQLSKSVETHYFRDGKTRVYNMDLEKYTTPRLDWVSSAPDRDTLTVFCRKDKRGFLNVNNGDIVIEAQYDKAWVFSEGVAAVVKGNKIGFIDACNEVVLPFCYYYSDRNGMGIDYLFRDGFCTMTDERGACGLIDREGNWVVEPLYDCIWTPHGDGYRIVKDGDKYGLLNPELEFAYPVEYDYIEFASEDAGILLTQNGRRWQVDFDGNITRPFVIDYTAWIYIPGSEDNEDARLSDYLKYEIDGRVGILRREDGSIFIPAIYESVNMLSEGVFEAQTHYDGDWILIDANGKTVEN